MNSRTIVRGLMLRFQYVLLAILTCTIYFWDVARSSNAVAGKTFIAFAVIYVIIFEVYLFFTNRRDRRFSKNIVDMLDMTSQKRLTDFPLPIIISNRDGKVLWYSEKFIATVGTDALKGLNSVFLLSSDILSSQTAVKIFFANRHFTVFSDCSVMNGRELYILYLFDSTDFQNLQKKYNMAKPVITHVQVDNYDELFQTANESEKSSAMAIIDKELSDWAKDVGGVMRKTEKDRYFFLFRNADLSGFIESRFAILDKIRALNLPSGASPSISIGIGIGNPRLYENEEFARLALDMALSRGGDQAVIKTETGFEFFGGKTKGIEKRTKVKSRVIAATLRETLKDVDSVIVMGHRASDFDCLGACVGIARIALAAKLNALIVYDKATSLASPLISNLKETSPEMAALFTDADKALTSMTPKTLLVIVDTHRAAYTAEPVLLVHASRIMVIDHHRKAADFIENAAIFFHEPYASSTCEMVTELMQYMNINTLAAGEAEALLAGIYLDTKGFTLRTSQHTFEASSFLRKMGASTVRVKKMFQTDMQTYMECTQMIQNAVIYKKIIAIATWPEYETARFRLAASLAADELLKIEDIQASFTIYEDKNGDVNISGRSFGDVNVQLILEKLKGGGHQTMAGAQLKATSIEDGTAILKRAVDMYFDENGITTDKQQSATRA